MAPVWERVVKHTPLTTTSLLSPKTSLDGPIRANIVIVKQSFHTEGRPLEQNVLILVFDALNLIRMPSTCPRVCSSTLPTKDWVSSPLTGAGPTIWTMMTRPRQLPTIPRPRNTPLRPITLLALTTRRPAHTIRLRVIILPRPLPLPRRQRAARKQLQRPARRRRALRRR